MKTEYSLSSENLYIKTWHLTKNSTLQKDTLSSLADYSHERGVATSFSKKQAVCELLVSLGLKFEVTSSQFPALYF